MMIRLAYAFALIALLPAMHCAQEKGLREIQGAIRTLDLKTGAMTLQLASSNKKMPLGLAARDLPVINLLGDKLALNDLREELRIAAKIRGENEVVAIRVEGPWLHGHIKKADASTHIITFKDVFGERTMTVGPDVKIVTRDGEISFESLKVGGAAHLLLSLDQKKVLQIRTGKGISARDPHLRVVRHYGILAELDRDKRTAQVLVQSADAGLIKSYEISPSVFLRLQYHMKPFAEVGLDQFAKWVKVYYFVDRDTDRIVSMNAEVPIMIRRKVVNVKLDKITIEDGGVNKELPIGSNVKVLTSRGEGTLADVTAGRIINCGLSADRKKLMLAYIFDR